MPTTAYQPGQTITVRDVDGNTWPAVYRGKSGKDGAIIEINGSRTRAALTDVKG